jgi:hypothetical protein
MVASGTPPDLTDLSLVSILSSAQKASASWYFLAAKAKSGLRSASIVPSAQLDHVAGGFLSFYVEAL